jgi:hypothetical protein
MIFQGVDEMSLSLYEQKNAEINFHLKKKEAKIVKYSTPKLVLPQMVA